MHSLEDVSGVTLLDKFCSFGDYVCLELNDGQVGYG